MTHFLTRVAAILVVSAPIMLAQNGFMAIKSAFGAEDEDRPPLGQEMIDYVNQWRTRAGRPPMQWMGMIDLVAKSHSDYLWNAHNGSIGHAETIRSSPDFRGEMPHDRVKLAYPAASAVGEVLGSSASGNAFNVIKDLFDAPFHRIGLLSNYKLAGAAAVYQPLERMDKVRSRYLETRPLITTLDLVDRNEPLSATSPEKPKFVVWPYNEQENANIDWYNFETPSPTPQEYYGHLLGYPISIQTPEFGQKLRQVVFTITDKNGKRITSANPQDGFMNYSDEIKGVYQNRDYAIFVPMRPWQKNMRYMVTATGVMDGVPFTINWHFTTVGATPLSAQIFPSPNRKTFDQDDEFNVVLSGGTGNYRGKDRDILIQYEIAKDQNEPPYAYKRLSNHEIRFRNLCHSLSHCQLRVKFFDSESSVTLNWQFNGY